MTDADINQLRYLLRAATPGALTVMARHAGEQCVAVVNNLELVPPYGVELAHERADADFLAAAVNALPGLLDEIERLRAMYNAQCAATDEFAEKYAAERERKSDARLAARIAELEQSLATVNKRLADAQDDAARLDYIEKHARYDPKIDGNHAWWPTTFENVLRGPTLRAAIDAASANYSEI